MPTHAAFLRAINVGGRRLDMASLRGHVEAAGLTDVATVLASGNVVFSCPDGRDDDIEAQLSAHLSEALGFDVPAMVRTARQVRAIVAHDPFPGVAPAGAKLHVGLLSRALPADARAAVLAMATPQDLLAVRGRELYWRRAGPMMEATIDTAELGRALGSVELTLRTSGTIEKVAARLVG